MAYWRLFYHFVWTTKDRRPLITPRIQQPLYRAIGSKAVDLGGIVHAIGGTEDHVHLVVSVPPKMSLSTFIGQVKGSSSHFINHEIRPEFSFAWQSEYGVLSFGERSLGRVVQYVHLQMQH
ncbi:MAG TPA: IS200/IS605 family transposase, partial [Thermoflexia bacterium]|nr:IS200/IS605 family transposase [Thermoflexia bacterium]